MKCDHPLIHLTERVSAWQPFRLIKGLSSAYIAYPIAQRTEKRDVLNKVAELRKYYKKPIEQRKKQAQNSIADILEYAKNNVPYYKDLFTSNHIEPPKIRKDLSYLNDIPFLTKDIILEQGDRLLSSSLSDSRRHACKTGGSTGRSCVIYYDQNAADYSSAVTLYARERAGNKKYKSELHFACRFPDPVQPDWPSREDFKCFAMNRTNIFFDRVDDEGLEEMWQTLKRRRPHMAHAHPSTIYALACYVGDKYGSGKAFEIFESSGELLEPYMRETISQNLRCQVINRYGLAELGVMAYEFDGHQGGLQVLDSEGWAESLPFEGAEPGEEELVFTGFRNHLMPLIRYRTGDIATVEENDKGLVLTNVVGRIHDLVSINGIDHATHYIQDMLDHRVGGIQEFQIDLRTTPPTLNIIPESLGNIEDIMQKIESFWGDGFKLNFVGNDDFVRVGRHSKFRHVVHP